MVIRYEKLQYQIDLQRLYDRKTELDRLLSTIPVEQDSLREQHQLHEDCYQQQKEHHRTVLQEQHGAESDLATYDTQLTKKNGQLHGVKTNKEYQTTLHEIEVLKQKVSEAEDRILSAMEQASEETARLAATKAELDKEQALHEERLSFLQQRLDEARDELATIDPQIVDLEAEGDPEMIDGFHRMQKARGRVVVPIEEGTCGGCHASVTLSKREIVKYGQQIEYCESCQRILYWPDEESATVNES